MDKSCATFFIRYSLHARRSLGGGWLNIGYSVPAYWFLSCMKFFNDLQRLFFSTSLFFNVSATGTKIVRNIFSHRINELVSVIVQNINNLPPAFWGKIIYSHSLRSNIRY